MQLAGAGTLAGAGVFSGMARVAAVPSPAAARPFQLGMASYTFREFSLEQCLAMTVKLGLKKISFKDFHLKMDATPEQIADTVAKVKAAGLDLYAGGVIYMRSEADVNRAFDYAKAAGMRMIIGVPNHDLLELVNKKVQQYDIGVAIHNHGPTDKVYPTPESAYEKIKNLDKRIGLCIDIGHTQRSGIDPSEPAAKYVDRLLDVHVKDVSQASAAGNTVEIGRGVIDIPKFMRTLIKINYRGIVALEYEKDSKDPLAGAAESIGYLQGVLAVI
jgi:sugar phosphate isomerase/epimerase